MLLKTLLLAVWAWGLASVLGVKSVPGSQVGRGIFWLLVVAHAVETVVYLPTLRAAGGSLAGHVLQTMLFGVLHLGELAPIAG